MGMMALQRLGKIFSNYAEILLDLDTKVYLKKEKIMPFWTSYISQLNGYCLKIEN